MKLLSIKSIYTSLVKASTLQKEATVSAIVYGVLAGDVSFTSKMSKEDAKLFTADLRPLLPIKTGKAGLEYSKKRVQNTLDKLGYTADLAELRAMYENKATRDSLVEEFIAKIEEYLSAESEEVILTDEEKKVKALNSVKTAVVKAFKANATPTEVLSLLVELGVDTATIKQAIKA